MTVAAFQSGISRHREPGVCVLLDDGDETILLVTWMEKNLAANTTGHAEMPGRIRGRKVTFTKSSGTLAADGMAFTIAEQDSWALGYGHQQGAHVYKIASGDHAGRVLCVFTRNDQVEEAWNNGATQDRNVYLTYSDDDGDTWSASVKIVDKDDLASPLSKVGIVTPGNGCFLQIPAGDHAGRVVFPAYYARSCVVYSDDGGDTWTVGGATPAVTGASEPNLSCWPDGTLVMTLRIDDSSDTRRWLTSADGGATWTDEGNLPGYQGTDCNAGLVQVDPAGATGIYGRIVISGPEGTPGGLGSTQRNHFAVRVAADAEMSLGERYALVNAGDYVGYSSVAYAKGTLFVAYETGTTAFNVDESVALRAVAYPPL